MVSDADRSWAVLIGADRFAADLPDIPAVRENLSALRAVLTDPQVGTLPQCHRVDGDATVADVGAALKEAAEAATDVLLVYYAGHGLVDDLGRLYLALADTDPRLPGYSAVPVELIKHDLAISSAANRVLILDCCFSGRAIEAMSAPDGLVAGQLAMAGSYTLTSTSANAPAYAPAGETYTAFTGALLRVLQRPEPLTLDEVYDQVDRELAGRGLPRPQRRAGNSAGSLVLARGGAGRLEPTPPPPEEITFTGQPPYSPAFTRFLATLGIGLLLVVPFAIWWALESARGFWLVAGLGLVQGLLLLSTSRTPPRTLVVGRSGLVVGFRPHTVRVPWADIAHLGLITHRTSTNSFHVLLVRLRPGVPPLTAPGLDRRPALWLVQAYEKLGYLAVCLCGVDPQELSAAVRRAGGRLYRSERELFDLNPDLAPTVARLRRWAPSSRPRRSDE
ncbi:caspase family protein [Micromonospora sp. URMC 103]|uniref:caspase family protein n=1 Tax=Micromonospora sp. URMC 103 TaxID=3423406 RepID=UPI003F1D61CA